MTEAGRGQRKPTPDREIIPVAQRLRVHYAKRGRLRFSSHRDFQRALERAIRRADIPIAYSAGFSPHPRISYANSAPTGTASEAEYVEIAVVRECDPEQVRDALDQALPPGLDVLRVIEAPDRDLGGTLQASQWRIELPGAEVELVSAAVEDFLSAPEVEVERLTKNGVRRFDARAAVATLLASEEAGCAILGAVIRHETPSVRPDDLLSALRNVANLVPPLPPRVTRLAQGPYDPVTGQVGDPFATAPVRS